MSVNYWIDTEISMISTKFSYLGMMYCIEYGV